MENRSLKIYFYFLAIFNAAFLAYNYYFDISRVAPPIFYTLRQALLVVLFIAFAIPAGKIICRYFSESGQAKSEKEEKVREERVDSISNPWILK
ncbi:hypothetical protein A3G54_00020 [Candidatus Giovannonibacteria bacterium RIFCSPLOWO2_12_FULL_44_15]|uniref:Uncharacterized protein n=1 Tax=Candidatus Giovannonibacteria bacterium RIFCSPLOWO2_12_FULL_44_15 TaxID=1798364 RepID=A0A1F5XZU4_9BACT|nr:MAG: hypothetical protein A3E62_03015 [Candidatus Giovannonibacteria bacterium RIFCSPHIGHO2_12_FULL_44_29]OGF93362.1 MAG: hypothetical protein A3G54_00020 [Candidatus Giovannonibacteria bacterium RIFCSPLOWO2_12_FULL_44_15]